MHKFHVRILIEMCQTLRYQHPLLLDRLNSDIVPENRRAQRLRLHNYTERSNETTVVSSSVYTRRKIRAIPCKPDISRGTPS